MGASIGDILKPKLSADYNRNAEINTPAGFQEPPESDIAYTQAMRPGYQVFGPSGQFQQPIYRSSYEQYAQPTGFYSPSYDVGTFYNPFMAYTPVAQSTGSLEVQNSDGGTEVTKTEGGAIHPQGIDSLLK